MIGSAGLRIFVSEADSISRATGSWFADGFTAGQNILVEGSSLNNGVFRIDSISADGLVLTLQSDTALTDEGPSAGVSVTGFESGVTVVANAGETAEQDVVATEIIQQVRIASYNFV